jgi:hypothetical protein
MTESPALAPTLADQAAAIDAIALAARIVGHGSRAAIGASTVEIIALARSVLTLSHIADLAFDMLSAADRFHAERNLDTRRAMRRAVDEKIDLLGASLEALGYGQPITNQENLEEEKTDVGTKD